ncbi:type II CRISPR RNA-guided endonuclease Cas9 [Verminephrobacter eiseniae]|uniref:type II CRISPR RNA-guided endonuclease Cas9 n=1 Tax=Verminephrobacter eiseniae TaxID=364317 RepID=UPI002238341C|nr:type II CRISPR RNA-guided endonuclease Cas9 [Verminephrobacter eiseniae]MCW5262183.1 type II CRISPR RNA-guided endonuclease Cas9 [Verminephrobacter eiseniae]
MNKAVAYRLALDLGSTSLGWAIFRLNEAREPTAIIRAGVRIFSDGRDAKSKPLAVHRRDARAMRRRRDRLLKRKKRMHDQLVQHGFFPADVVERKELERLNPYQLRAKGLHEALTPGEFARALFHINQRRGFKSNRKTDRKDNDSGALKQAISELRKRIQDSGCATAGEWFWKERMQQKPEGVRDQWVRARYRETPSTTDEGKKRIGYDLYVDRAMVEQEFDALWAAQAALQPGLFTEAARAELKDTLLYQRDLRPVKPGRCTLLHEEPRAPLALPSTQRFRILQEVNNLRILDEALREVPLNLAQRDAVVSALEGKNKLSFAAIRKLLTLSGKFNLEDEKRAELKGNATSVILARKDLFGDAWAGFDAALQDEIVWQLVSQESEGALIAWLQQHTGVDEACAEAIVNTRLPDGYGRLSRKALERIVPALQREVCTYDKAVQAAGFAHHSDLGFDFDYAEDEVQQVGERTIASTGEVQALYAFKQLPYYGKALQRHVAFGSGKPEDHEEKCYGKIANPTVHIGLNQVRTVVNALIRRYGRPTEVVVELARDLKQSREQRQQTQREQADNQKRNTRIRDLVAQTSGTSPEHVRGSDIQKWILWEELSRDAADRRCPYSGAQISAAMLLGEAVEIEHILPFSRTLDDSLNNRTVAMRRANRIKGDRTPWEARADFAAQGWHYEAILQRAEGMPPRKRYRFAEDGYQRWLGKDQDFLARALNDTSYLSRLAANYLRLVCPQGVRVIPGQMTAKLRGKFGLNFVLGLDGKKNRNDHRHHAVDACVISVTDQGLMQRFANASKQARENGLTRLVQDMPLPWPSYRDHVERAVRHIRVSHRPDHGFEGAMMEETAHGIREDGIRKDGRIKQRPKAKGSADRETITLIPIDEPRQLARHGVDAEGKPLPYKGYASGSNYCIEITKNGKGKWEGQVISTFDAYRIVRESGWERLRGAQSQNRQPLVMRLMIGDSVRMEVDGRDEVMRVVKMSGTTGQMYFAPVCEANVDKRNNMPDEQDPFAYTTKYAGSLQKAKARQVTISRIGELRDPGFQG